MAFFSFLFRGTEIEDTVTLLDGDFFRLGFRDSIETGEDIALDVSGDDVFIINRGDIETDGAAAAINVTGDDARLFNSRGGEIEAEGDGASAVTITGSADITNFGDIEGAFNGINFSGIDAGGSFFNGRSGEVTSDSRVVNIDGDGVVVRNFGDLIGTGDQRNGTVYSNDTASNFTVLNGRTGVIDAGEGNDGAGFSLSLVEGGGSGVNTITNRGDIIGRGQAAPDLGTAGDGVRLEADGTDGTGLFEGRIFNSGLFFSESTVGPVGGFRAIDGVDFAGELINARSGEIVGVQNGVYFGTGDHSEGTVTNHGLITSDSRAVNIDGDGLTLINSGDILGTGDQRNGTVYSDSTASNHTVINERRGVIDAGAGNQGSGFGQEIAAEGNIFTLINDGTIQGRGNAGAASNLAGDGVRIGNVGNIGVADGTITNTGLIDSEGANGTVAGVRFVNGVSFQGTFDNSGTINGVQNGVYFGNPVDGQGGDHTGGIFNNLEGGLITSASRAFNIDGIGLEVNNSGEIIGTGDQRNGTVYGDSTAQDYTFNNLESGVIDAGAGNQGSGFGQEIAAEGNIFTLINDGTIQGRGNAGAASNLAGDGVRIGNVGNEGVADGTITNTGLIDSEGANGTVAGVRFVNGVSFEGTLFNEAGGAISGVQNGVYFGTGSHDGGLVVNDGIITSDSRAFNLDGDGLTVVNNGNILGTGDQRNGTFYGDGTADDFTVINTEDGVIDAGEGNDGSALAFEIGDADNDVVNGFVLNEGDLIGRGDNAGANLIGHGLRFVGGDDDAFAGTVVNTGLIEGSTDSAAAAGVSIEGIALTGVLINDGTITGLETAIDASSANGATIVNAGTIVGDVILSDADDVFVLEEGGSIDGVLDGGAGSNDTLVLNDGTTQAELDQLIADGDVTGFETFIFEDDGIFDLAALEAAAEDLSDDVADLFGDFDAADGGTAAADLAGEISGFETPPLFDGTDLFA